MLTAAYVLTGLIGVAIIFLGARDLLAPQSAATGFGLPSGATESRNSYAWLSVRAVRDIASGLFIFILLANHKPHVLGLGHPGCLHHPYRRRLGRSAQ